MPHEMTHGATPYILDIEEGIKLLKHLASDRALPTHIEPSSVASLVADGLLLRVEQVRRLVEEA